MNLSRRHFLATGAAGVAALATGLPARAQTAPVFAPTPDKWRHFEVKTKLALAEVKGGAQAWIPLPSFADEAWMRPGETTFSSASGKVERVRDARSGAEMLRVRWGEGEASPQIEVTSRFATRDRKGAIATTLSDADRKLYTAATELLPTDGIVRDTALKITAGANGDEDKARRIFEWIVDNTFRDPKTRGCGVGDIAAMLRTGNLSGKCADLNALFVGLARASGLPARDIYGIRVAPSAFGYKSLGANSETVTKAQHCRAEVFITGAGWLAVDPADVRKVVLEEPPGNLAVQDAKVAAARAGLFGGWEGNWLAYNSAHDVALPGAKGARLPFLMYPQAETASGGRLDCLDPDTFRYSITARAIEA